jgi:hypothetical protein
MWSFYIHEVQETGMAHLGFGLTKAHGMAIAQYWGTKYFKNIFNHIQMA